MIFNVNKEGGILTKLMFEGFTSECNTCKYLQEKEYFTGKKGEVYFYLNVQDNKKVLFVGLGKEEKLDYETLRTVFFNIGMKLYEIKENEVSIKLPKYNGLCQRKAARAASEGLLHATYRNNKYKTDRKELPELTVNFTVDEAKVEKVTSGIKEAEILAEGIFLTRELVNTPAIDMYPVILADRAEKALSPLGVKVSVYNKKEVEEIGMHAYLSVARASAKEPRLIVMEYKNNPDSDELIGLVGKGITYDTGGYSLKPSDGMKTMFTDMAGGATVIGAIHALAKSNAKVNVVGVVAACENAVSGDGYKPGDIVSSLKGSTIEVDNTDAEGRVTLADSIYYTVNNLKATKVIDLATLTGACLVALGEVYTGSVTNNAELFSKVKQAGEVAGEKIWLLPSDDKFRELNKSTVADIKNTGGRFAGTITAGLFLEHFVGNTPWVHLDIAGTAFLSKSYDYLPLGATGMCVKTLYHLVKDVELETTKACEI